MSGTNDARDAVTRTSIEMISVRHIRMQLKNPFVTALGVEHERNIVIVEVRQGDYVGYGEVPVLAQPVYNEETVETAWHVLNDFFIPRVLARPLHAPPDVPELLSPFRGHPMARAGLEAAVWDLWAKRHGISLRTALARAGAAFGDGHIGAKERVPAGVALGFADDIDALLATVEASIEQRYRRIKIKIEPGRDVDVVAAVRRAFPHIVLAVDANGAYELADVGRLQRLDEFGLSMIEQPLAWDDLHDHAELQRHMETAVCLDESIRTREHMRQAIALGSCRTVNVKASRVGGLTEALATHDMALAAGVPLWCGGLLETGIGRAHNVALASLPAFTLPGDLSPSARYWHEDIVTPAFTLDAEGYMTVPDGPGIGVEVNTDMLDALTVRQRTHTIGPVAGG